MAAALIITLGTVALTGPADAQAVDPPPQSPGPCYGQVANSQWSNDVVYVKTALRLGDDGLVMFEDHVLRPGQVWWGERGNAIYAFQIPTDANGRNVVIWYTDMITKQRYPAWEGTLDDRLYSVNPCHAAFIFIP